MTHWLCPIRPQVLDSCDPVIVAWVARPTTDTGSGCWAPGPVGVHGSWRGCQALKEHSYSGADPNTPLSHPPGFLGTMRQWGGQRPLQGAPLMGSQLSCDAGQAALNATRCPQLDTVLDPALLGALPEGALELSGLYKLSVEAHKGMAAEQGCRCPPIARGSSSSQSLGANFCLGTTGSTGAGPGGPCPMAQPPLGR